MVGSPVGRLEVPSARQDLDSRGQTCVDQFNEIGVQRLIRVQRAGEVPGVDGPLSDSHAKQLAGRQLTHRVPHRALQGDGLAECGDHLSGAVPTPVERVVPEPAAEAGGGLVGAGGVMLGGSPGGGCGR